MLKRFWSGVSLLGCLLAVGSWYLSSSGWLSSLARAQQPAQTTRSTQTQLRVAQTDDDYFNIGSMHCAVSTKSALAQRWFDRGLAMCHGFNHEEAVYCFEQAIQADPGCAMAYWGMAYAWGPNINNMQMEDALTGQAVLAMKLAQLHSGQLQSWEKALLDATSTRYILPVVEDRAPLNKAYADAMRTVSQQFPDNRLITALFAESLMDLRPWRLWAADGTPAPETPELISVLERGLEKWPEDPMLCHLYIHAIEASPTPEKGLAAASRLRNYRSDLGHLVHMPTHIDVQVGNYEQMIRSNQAAIEKDNAFVAKRGRHNLYSIYRIHNYHFAVYGAMFDGQSTVALNLSRQLVEEIPPELLSTHASLLDPFISVPLHTLIRFGKWEDILKEPKPADQLPFTQAMWHYARGIAYAATNRVALAEQEQSSFELACKSIPDTSQFHNNSSREIAEVAKAMLHGEIAYRRGEFASAFESLRRAVQLEDKLNYDEPWGWMQPTRHALGALLLEQKEFAQAEQVYRDDLKRHPNNVWSLQGLTECLEVAQNPEAAQVRQAYQAAAQRCDFSVNRSCMCRQAKTDWVEKK